MKNGGEMEKIYGPLGRQIEIETLPEEFMFFDDENEGLLVHMPCASVIARFGTNVGPEAILNAASKHEWCPALGAGISTG